MGQVCTPCRSQPITIEDTDAVTKNTEGVPANAVYPMWLLRVRDVVNGKFIDESGIPKSHEQMVEEGGLLTMWSPDKFCIFVSHRWLSKEHPDPEGAQMQVLREVLSNIIDGSVDVAADIFAELVWQKPAAMEEDERRKIESGYIWIDWSSIPQIAGRMESGSKTDMLRAVESIPSYVAASQVFMALVPPLMHKISNESCNYDTWITRGWCRVEFCCRGILPNAGHIMVAKSARHVEYMTSMQWIYSAPLDGQFAVPADAERMVKPLLVSAFDTRIASHKERMDAGDEAANHSVYYRWAVASKMRYTKSTTATSMWEFTYKLESLLDVGEAGWSPLMCAAVEGNDEMVAKILAAGASVNDQVKQSFPDLAILKGTIALHFAAEGSSP
eukprot:gnl/TRDRNA2_/TRDRNA2_176854_c8_seq8.p1 gnl/TRDRNA2_/TRDRNA2_176854_c8~~gnl/TRDRNA2_/TRDRNA2_176854_c8_seq8.p1  ORF type:complete len:387 (+),score=64.43 gnl/TRDRNA2_/TRDRNA2_176854_c8_seq8:85-1245(+)